MSKDSFTILFLLKYTSVFLSVTKDYLTLFVAYTYTFSLRNESYARNAEDQIISLKDVIVFFAGFQNTTQIGSYRRPAHRVLFILLTFCIVDPLLF